MKLISLNTFGGHVFEPMMKFVETHASTTDVFCFQEMVSTEDREAIKTSNGWRVNLLQELIDALPEFEHHFAPMQQDFQTEPDYPNQSQFGVAIFYRKILSISDKGFFFICNGPNTLIDKDWSTLGHTAAHITVEIAQQPITILTLHGNSQPGDKLDSPLRIEQSRRILELLARHEGAKIVTGDFNLLPGTKSIQLFEEAGFKNLISDYDIKTTRGSMMRKLFPEYEHGEYGFQEFADYTFVTPDIDVTQFSVPDEPISDHLPMILEFDL